MTTNTKESGFESYIEQYLIKKNGYVVRTPKDYDKDVCVDREILLRFIKNTQAEQWELLLAQHSVQAEEKFLERLSSEIKARGLLDVLRNGIKDNGARFSLAYFKPNTKLNEETQAEYASNIFSIMRQVKYSNKNEYSLDMVIFLNGIPLFTMELKNQLTGQSVHNALRQYKTDRDPKEMLLSFKRCLVHFAVDTEEVFMTTRLNGLKTYFLPFNKGDGMSAGNPVAKNKYKTEYLWEDILTKDTVLEIINRFMHLEVEEKVDDKGKKYTVEKLIFPRYHQFDTVRRLIQDSKESGAGRNYLIQHSAGSGKSNSIAWTAHHLAELHDNNDEKVFSSVIIITDRRVLDKQLQNTVSQFEQVRGVVKKIDQHSSQLREALEQGEKIIVTTLQKFPVIIDDIEKLAGKNFAVIIDEAHSSQTGENVKSMKQVLSTNNLDEAEKEEAFEVETSEDWVIKQMKSRGKAKNVSFFAFTATPKQKTLEIFGEKQFDGQFRPFSVYSMKQAIDEGFILDILKNYTTYRMYFSLLKKAQDDPEFKKKKAQRLLISFVERNEHAINKKVEIIVNHFWDNIAREAEGKAKAMVVTKSRLHAVKFKQAIDKYIKEQNLPIKSLVAFSGTVEDGELEYTEQSMNNLGRLVKKDQEDPIAEEFKKDDYKFLIVAEKFQTGFDQPLLTAMYVDKKLGGVSAVQTLSRLNRTCPSKEETFVLDFVNETESIEEAFQPYYTTTILSEATDPNILHDLQRDIMDYKLFSEQEIEGFVSLYFRGVQPSELNNFLDVIVDRYKEIEDDEQRECKKKISEYTKKYAFISQIISFSDSSLEKLYIFLRLLRKKLPFLGERLPVEVLESVDLESIKIPKIGTTSIKLEKEDGILEPIEGRDRGNIEDEKEALSKILKDVNDRFGTDFSDEDRIILNNLTKRLMSDESLVGAVKNNNSQDAIKVKFDEVFGKELMSMFRRNFDLYKKLDSNEDLKDYVNKKMFDFIQKKLKHEGEKDNTQN